MSSLTAGSPRSGVVPTADGALSKRCPECGGRYPPDFRVCPRDALPLEDAPADEDPLVGTVLSDTYEVMGVIGEGGMGKVYEARHVRLASKRYAIKVLHGDLARQPEVVSRFQREAEAASALTHPNVVGVFDVNRTPDGRPFMVAELLEGEQLGDYLERCEKLAPAAAVRIVRQVCFALDAAHARGIVHRDVKPENVFLAGDANAPIVKVLDFGISKIAEGASLTKTGMVMGTPAYMAPEQARGDKVDHRVDIYAVGAILYRAVTGRKPFEDDDPVATLSAVLVEDPPRPCSIEPSVPAALELVIQKAMAKRPGERYATLEDFEADLAAFDTGEPMPATSAVASGPAPRTLITAANQGEATARTMLASGSSTMNLARAGRDSKLARPSIVVLSFVGWLWVTAALADVIAAAIRAIGNRTDLAGAESALVMAGAVAAMMTPAVLWIRHLRLGVWHSSPRSVDLAARLRRAALFMATTYAILALAVRMFEVVVNRNTAGLGWPIWSFALFAASLVAGIAAWMSHRKTG
jgi:serine/threonine protein kinase